MALKEGNKVLAKVRADEEIFPLCGHDWTSPKSAKKRAKCRECKRVMMIQGRGLCGKCLYHVLKKEKERKR
jgi:hypothetical protein